MVTFIVLSPQPDIHSPIKPPNKRKAMGLAQVLGATLRDMNAVSEVYQFIITRVITRVYDDFIYVFSGWQVKRSCGKSARLGLGHLGSVDCFSGEITLSGA